MQQQFALVGCGNISGRHAENIITLGSLVAVCDIVPEKANEIAKKYNARPYYSLENMLQEEKELTVASICTPNGLHAKHAIECLKSGLHVLCEKPLCIKSEDGSLMIQTAAENGKYLFVVKQNRFNPPVVEVKKICDENKLGKISGFQINCFWNRPPEYYSGTWRGHQGIRWRHVIYSIQSLY